MRRQPARPLEQPLTAALRSLSHNDGTTAAKPMSEEDRKWFFEAMAVRWRKVAEGGGLNPPAGRLRRWTRSSA